MIYALLNILGIYLSGCFIYFMSVITDILPNKYDSAKQMLLWPITLFISITKLKITNNYSITKNSKMNLKILFKAMSFMFLPTLGVMLLLLVGFWSVTDLWKFITSDTGGAITIRILLFIAECGLVIGMYFYYLDEYTKEQLLKGDVKNKPKKPASGISYIEDVFFNGRMRGSKYYIYGTENSNLILIERIKDND